MPVSSGQQLDGVDRLDREPGLAYATGELQQAAGIPGRHSIGLRLTKSLSPEQERINDRT